MTRKHVHSPAFRAVSIVLTMLFMWGFGLSVLLVLMHISIGFADNDADFRKAFLELTDDEELEDIVNYAETYMRSLDAPGEGYESAIKSYQMQYSPDNTNYRFVLSDKNDKEGGVLLQNDPSYNPDADVMASAVRTVTLTLNDRYYPVQKEFTDPVKSFNGIIYGDNSLRHSTMTSTSSPMTNRIRTGNTSARRPKRKPTTTRANTAAAPNGRSSRTPAPIWQMPNSFSRIHPQP